MSTTSPDPATDPPSREHVMGSAITWMAAWSGRWILIVLGLYATFHVLGMAWSVLMPVVLALLVTAVLAPLAGVLERKLRFSVAAAAAGTLGLGAVVVTLLVILMAPSIGAQSTAIANDTVAGIGQLQTWVQESNLLNKEQIDSFLSSTKSKLSESSSAIASGVMSGVGAVTSVVVNIVVVAFLTFFFLKDGRKFLPWLSNATGPSVGTHLVDVSGRAWAALGGFIRTQALVSAIDATLIGIGLVIIGVPLAVPLAVLTFFGGFVPIIGALAAGAIAVLVALVSNGVTGAVWVLVLVVAVQQIEGNLLSPWLQSKSVNLHPAIVLLSVMLGTSMFGIAGAFLAVPAAAVAAVIFRYLHERVNEAVGLDDPEPAEQAEAPA